MYHSKGYSKVFFIIVLLAPLNGNNIEKFSEAFGEVGGGPMKILAKTLALFGNHKQKAIKSKRR